MMNMASMMKEAQKMQKKMTEVQDQIKIYVADGSSGGGLVRVSMSGAYRMLSIEIDSSLMSEDKTMMEDLILTATNDAFQKIEAYKESLMKGFPLPPGISF